ncbi:MAG: UDP-2,3-diacylglucosamine diphosphatase [Bacteroidetes bacterium]|nr:UDP-2,3-diacylglucosamine diphosphatase [Bacteroidota bacterium]MBS1943938.1 UDP-2,3-diacylglucosamine diphosphatase [Bacteroidota bacterium]
MELPHKENNRKRDVELVVISDVHLGTYGCRAEELLNYLRTVRPRTLVLNGDIVDIWQFNKRYFPPAHIKVIKSITSMLAKGTQVYYITGNHDELFRKFSGFELGGLHLLNKVVLELDGQKAWFFHGDVFDVTMRHSRWLAKLGGHGYDLLILLNTFFNRVSRLFGGGRISLSRKIKNSVKSAVKYINDFEGTAALIALDNHYDQVICGHIHQPAMRHLQDEQGRSVLYLNSGDWVENLTALEYNGGQWNIYRYADDPVAKGRLDAGEDDHELTRAAHSPHELFTALVAELCTVERAPFQAST